MNLKQAMSVVEMAIHYYSLYRIKEKSEANAWGSLHDKLLVTFVESSCLIPGQLCINSQICNNEATIRCLKCGPGVFYCSSCFNTAHSDRKIFSCWRNVGGMFLNYMYTKPRIHR